MTSNFDSRKLATAIEYVNRIANGKNPVTNKLATEDSVINDPNVIRCMFFIKDVLEVAHMDAVKEEKKQEVKNTTTPKKQKVPFSYNCLKNFSYQEDKSITHVLDQMRLLTGDPDTKRIPAKKVNDWLKDHGYLVDEYCAEVDKETTLPTKRGAAIGIYGEHKVYGDRSYILIMYNKEAQEFLAKNLETILSDAKQE